MQTVLERLNQIWSATNSLVCVGLDSEPSKIPAFLKGDILTFNKQIIDATASLVCAYKPQIAHYAAIGAEKELEKTIHYIKSKYPHVYVVLDSKRGDIGNTAQMYAKEAFERYAADAVTVNPYLGFDSLEPFLNYKEKGVIVLCRTSNPSAKDFQDMLVEGKPLYMHVAERATTEWNTHQNVSLVVGATYPQEIRAVRGIVGDMPLLVPGIGAQGGDVKATVLAGIDSKKRGMLINSSRAILYAGSEEDFAEKAAKAALALKEEINSFR